MHIGDTCFEEIYFTVIDDQLELVLNRPVRAMKERKCVPGMKVEVVATAKGFAVSPSDVGAEFDLASKSFQKDSSFPPQTSVASELAPPPESEVVYGTEVLERSFGGNSVIRTWLANGQPRQSGDFQLRYEYSPDGEKATKQGTVMSVKQDDQHFFTTRLVRTGETVSLFVALRHEIFRQRFRADGEPLGKVEQIVEEKDSEKTKFPEDGNSIHNLNVAVLGADCVILYTRGNGGMKVFSCKTGNKRYLGEAHHPTMSCADGRCIISESGSRIRFLEL